MVGPGITRTHLGTALLVLVALFAVACGGGSADQSASSRDAETLPLLRALEFLGTMHGGSTNPVAIEVDGTASSHDLGAGVNLDVPQGAFAASTDLAYSVTTLAFEDVTSESLSGSLYQLGTSRDVVLGSPVVLDIPGDPADVWVAQLVDDTWTPVDVPSGPSIRVPIEHFSDVSTAVVERPKTTADAAAPTDGIVPADFFQTCIGMFLSFTNGDDDQFEDDQFLVNRGLSFCTTALVRVLTPPGEEWASVACVGDRIGGEVDIRGAIAQCITERDGKPEQEADASEPAERDGLADSDTAPAPVDQTLALAPRTWTGEFVDIAGNPGGAWSTTRTTRITVEQGATGLLTLARETDVDHEADPAVFANPCIYVVFEDGSAESSGVQPDNRLRFEGSYTLSYLGTDCSAESGPQPGTFTELVTGTLSGDELVLDSWYDGQGPVTLDLNE